MPFSPMMQQYLEIKKQYKDAFVLFRLGDFYEMFFDDAIKASKELDLTLTARDSGMPERAPMCGVPYHSVDGYIAKLISKGYSVAICEQGEVVAGKKGLVERKVSRLITRGTADPSMIDDNVNNYIMCVYYETDKIGVAYSDITTGEFNVQEYTKNALSKLNDCLSRVRPSEIICNCECLPISKNLAAVIYGQSPAFKVYENGEFSFEKAAPVTQAQFKLAAAEMRERPLAAVASGVLIGYLEETQKRHLSQLSSAVAFEENLFMTLDHNTRRNLELTENIRDRKNKGSLLYQINRTVTSMGARKFKSWIEQPLYNLSAIRGRHDAVGRLLGNVILCSELTGYLKKAYDIERLISRLSFGTFSPQNAVALKETLLIVPAVKAALSSLTSPYLKEISKNLLPLKDIADLLERAIVTEKTPAITRDGGFIKRGYNAELDELSSLSENASVLLNRLEAAERQETGIKNLKIGFNNVFGYYIEVSKSQVEMVPYRYSRRQTIANGERYITEELKVLEDKIISARDKCIKLELTLFAEICEKLTRETANIQSVASALSSLDCLLSFANAAYEHNYVMPEMTGGGELIIKDGRHPVVEAMLEGEKFTPNDCTLDTNENRVLIITGPNMSGKSTYMRQAALITLMAHAGSFVPAKNAVIPLTDRIFTRIGASDDVAFGQSTFMVEMTEVAEILKFCTDKSLLILDEIGRGTSTYDGLSIAMAIVEYLSAETKSKTLFSTHYHELTQAEEKFKGVKNLCVSVKETENGIIFLHKILHGKSDKSFGIEVAKMAGLPDSVVKRAKEIMKKLEERE